MKTTNLSKFMYGAGVITIFFAFIQWYIKFPDLSQLMFGLHISLTIIACAYFHSWMRNKDEEIKELDMALNKIHDYAWNEFESLKKLR